MAARNRFGGAAAPALAAGAAVLLLVGWGGAPGAAGAVPGKGHPPTVPDTTVVGMSNALDFTPDSVVIEAGETVVWRNSSVLVHTVTAIADSAADPGRVELPDGAEPFGSGRLGPNETYRRTFEVPGTYRYVCLPHEAAGMIGTVVVEEAS